ncbi:putative quinoprotein amine dehydrogenase, beta chain [Plasmopara halstedii]
MELLDDAAWQWRSKATLTAADTSQWCTVFAIKFNDCAILRIYWDDDYATYSQIMDPQTSTEGSLELHGHTERINCVNIFQLHQSNIMIGSASRDWSCVKQSILVEHLPAEPRWVAFDVTSTILAVACERVIKVFVIDRKELLVTLEGHLSCITAGKFHPIHHNLLITASEDRTFKIWDLAAKTLWYQSAVLSAFAILSIALNPMNGDAAFGFADGSVKVFALTEGHTKQLVGCNVEAYIQKLLQNKQEAEADTRREEPQIINCLPFWASSRNNRRFKSKCGSSDGDDDSMNVTISCPVLAMRYICTERKDFTITKEGGLHSCDGKLLDHEQFLIIGTPGYLLSVNAYSFKIATIHDFQQSVETPRCSLEPICIAKDFCFVDLPQRNILCCGIISAFQPCFTMLYTLTSSNDPNRGNQAHENVSEPFDETSLFSAKREVSVIPNGPPPEDSVLNASPLSAKKTPSKKAYDLNKPITFHTRIKSSGYGSSSSLLKSRRTIHRSTSDNQRKGSKSVSSYLKEYPTKCELLQHFQRQHALSPKALHQGAILHIEYSSDAKWLATSGNDRTAQVCKLPISRFKGYGKVYVGHNQAVRAIHWSQNNQMLVTIGGDKTSRVWLAENETSLLTLRGIAPPSGVAVAASAMRNWSSAKKALRQDIVDASFFYMDKFLLSACGNTTRLHQYELDEACARAPSRKARSREKASDVEILENKSRKKCVAHWSFDDMQSITSLACVNGAFLSSIAVIAGSDRSLRVLDVGAGGGGRTVRIFRDAHSRAVHTVTLPRPTCYASHPSNFYDLLLSSCLDSTIHLWDIRADNCVMRFCQHKNRVHTLGVNFSPCMRYVATGSEDQAAYIYDIRTGRQLVRLTGHTDVVTSVAFSPLYPQLATASCDGTIRFYSNEKSD